MIVKSIARAKVDIARIGYKDTVSYFNILLDESVRRTFCRLYFNRKVKYVAIFDVEKNDFVKHVI
ncbi:MAG: restriction endonuclease, partial [Prevotellaceae bacterium]|nr:restriction endonuclease [Prevotellaceae bacterium]